MPLAKLDNMAQFYVVAMLEENGPMSVGELFTHSGKLFETPLTTVSLWGACTDLEKRGVLKQNGLTYELVPQIGNLLDAENVLYLSRNKPENSNGVE